MVPKGLLVMPFLQLLHLKKLALQALHRRDEQWNASPAASLNVGGCADMMAALLVMASSYELASLQI